MDTKAIFLDRVLIAMDPKLIVLDTELPASARQPILQLESRLPVRAACFYAETEPNATHTHTHTNTHTQMRTWKNTHARTHARTRARAHTHTHKCARVNTHKHTHKHARIQGELADSMTFGQENDARLT